MSHPLSRHLKSVVENLFLIGEYRIATFLAVVAADARDLETRLHQAELKLALMSEEE